MVCWLNAGTPIAGKLKWKRNLELNSETNSVSNSEKQHLARLVKIA
jgi:hypothetical protein